MEEELNTDSQKGDNSRFPLEIWDRRAGGYERGRESGSLNILRESMLRWRRQKLTREFSQVLRRSSGTWKRVGSSRGIMEVDGEYVWIDWSRRVLPTKQT